MVNRNLLRQFDLAEEDLQQELGDVFGDEEHWLPQVFAVVWGACALETLSLRYRRYRRGSSLQDRAP